MAQVAQQQRHTELQPGDRVVWNSFGIGQAKGTIVEKFTENKKVGSRVFKASPDDPKFVVKSETSGKIAVRKPEALRKRDENEQGDGGHGADAGGDPLEEDNGRGASLGVKEKREERSDEEEEEEVEEEEEPKKMPDTGKGTVRATLAAAKAAEAETDAGGEDEDVPAAEDEGLAPEEEDDTTYDPKEEGGAAEDDEEDIDKMPLDEELLAEEELVAKGGEESRLKDRPPAAASKKTDLQSGVLELEAL